MQIDGIWDVKILGVYGWESGGILVLDRGRAAGGNNHHYMKGTYNTSGDSVRVSLVAHFFNTPPILFGVRRDLIVISFEGRLSDDKITGNATRSGNPAKSIRVRCHRLDTLAPPMEDQ